MKCFLGITNFLKEISGLSHSIVFLYFFALITEESFLVSPLYSSNSAFKCIYLSFSPSPCLLSSYCVTDADRIRLESRLPSLNCYCKMPTVWWVPHLYVKVVLLIAFIFVEWLTVFNNWDLLFYVLCLSDCPEAWNAIAKEICCGIGRAHVDHNGSCPHRDLQLNMVESWDPSAGDWPPYHINTTQTLERRNLTFLFSPLSS